MISACWSTMLVCKLQHAAAAAACCCLPLPGACRLHTCVCTCCLCQARMYLRCPVRRAVRLTCRNTFGHLCRLQLWLIMLTFTVNPMT